MTIKPGDPVRGNDWPPEMPTGVAERIDGETVRITFEGYPRLVVYYLARNLRREGTLSEPKDERWTERVAALVAARIGSSDRSFVENKAMAAEIIAAYAREPDGWKQKIEEAISIGTGTEGWPAVASELARWLIAASHTARAAESVVVVQGYGRVQINIGPNDRP